MIKMRYWNFPPLWHMKSQHNVSLLPQEGVAKASLVRGEGWCEGIRDKVLILITLIPAFSLEGRRNGTFCDTRLRERELIKQQ